MITIKDVAKASGFSASTVSRALADSDLIPEKSKNLIKNVAKKMGYIPNLTAKSLKVKKSRNIGVINFVDEEFGYAHNLFSGILNSFIVEMGKVSYDIAIISNYFLSKGEDLVAYCKSRNMDGVLLLVGDFGKPEMKKLQESDIATVVIDGYEGWTYDKSFYVSSNNREIMEKLTEKIIRKGHRRIVYVHGEDYFVTRERIIGFKAALERADIPFQEDMLVPGRFYDMASVPSILDSILSREAVPTCLIMPDDYCALKAYGELHKRGITIPDDISIAGFDGLEYVKHIYPTLTTVVQDVKALGKICAELMISAIEGNKPPHMTFIDAAVFEGESVRKIAPENGSTI
ncbi:MAG: LacI family DNA-binding transcriptional regulator [Candidatus Gallimonas sp.]